MKKNGNVSNRIAVASIIAAGSLWGMMGLFVRGLASETLSTMEIVFFRSVVAAFIMLVVILFTDRKSLRVKLKDIWCFVGTGLVSLTAFNICYFSTIQRTSMAVAAILLYTSPIFVVLLSGLLFKERITWIKIVALIVAFAGCVFVTGIVSSEGLVMDITGILIGIGAGVGYALYSIFGRYAIDRGYGSITITFYTFVFASIGMFVTSPLLSPIGITIEKIASGNTLKSVMLIAGIALFATVLPYLLYTYGLSGVENGKAGIMASIEPVVAAVLGIIVYKEELSVSTFAGVILVLASIVLLNVKSGE